MCLPFTASNRARFPHMHSYDESVAAFPAEHPLGVAYAALRRERFAGLRRETETG